MMTPRERYLNDPQFHALVDTIRAMIDRAEMTPTEIREAAMLAQIMYEQEAHPRQYYVLGETVAAHRE